MLRHDISSFTLPADDIFKAASITALKFDLLKQGLLNEGCIDLDLLKCLLYPMFSSGMIKSYEKVSNLYSIGNIIIKTVVGNSTFFEIWLYYHQRQINSVMVNITATNGSKDLQLQCSQCFVICVR